MVVYITVYVFANVVCEIWFNRLLGYVLSKLYILFDLKGFKGLRFCLSSLNDTICKEHAVLRNVSINILL